MKTAEQEKLQGYPGHRPKKTNMPIPDYNNLPDPPRWMGRIGKRAYYDLMELVGSKGMRVMAKSDRLALVMVCEAFEEYRNCKNEIKTHGRYWLDKNTMKKHPAITDMQNAWTRIMSGLSKFGMTPYDRQKVTVLPSDKKEKTREELMQEKRALALASAKKKMHLKTVNG